jgi:prepilin-type N-terminal cleavage/methylation domain-containing protein
VHFTTDARKVQRPRRRRGYTLLEMLIVVTIVALTAGIALPRVNVAWYAADANAEIVRTTLQNAQRLAVTRQHDVLVSFDTARGVMRMLEDKNNNQVADAGERIIGRALDKTARFGGPVAAIPTSLGSTGGTRAVSVAGTARSLGGLPCIVFHRNGSASNDVDIYLRSVRRTITEYRGISLVQSTGRTEWYRYSTVVPTWRKANM